MMTTTVKPGKSEQQMARELLVVSAIENQNALNARLNERWYAQGWRYYRAVWTEAAEAVQHIKSWLWWKEGEYAKPPSGKDAQQVKMELVDILHFGLSMQFATVIERLTKSQDSRTGSEMLRDHAEYYVRCFENESQGADFEKVCGQLEQLVGYACRDQTFSTRFFAGACMAAGMDLDETFSLYFAKTALNRFRWKNGYNLPAGDINKYVKMWTYWKETGDGWQKTAGKVEDNEVLFDVAQMLIDQGDSAFAIGHEAFMAKVEEALSPIYKMQ